jgi:hypothetical protein
VLFLGVLPIWPHSGNWGYLPSGGVGFLFVVLILLTLMGWSERPATKKLYWERALIDEWASAGGSTFVAVTRFLGAASRLYSDVCTGSQV